MNDILESETFSATIAIAPVVCPVIFSPITNSVVVVDELVSVFRTAVGHDATDVSEDSKIP